ncbi:MAG: DUF3179 domain-containing protein [Phycisphaerales bacterium]|nr:MAG: DUF3179 domain-containing protein [Phycisphaerales bacterium]
MADRGVVHTRTKGDQVDEFGVSGYVYKNTFMIFDRKTESLWYPLDDDNWTAISGPRKGEKIPIVKEPQVETLGEWRKRHPQTKVLLGSKREIEAAKGE